MWDGAIPKTISVAQLGHGGASRAIREAQREPVLVSKQNRPAAWILSTDRLAEAAAHSAPPRLALANRDESSNATSGKAAKKSSPNACSSSRTC